MTQRSLLNAIRLQVFFWLFLCIVSLSASLAFAFRAGRIMGRAEQPQLLLMNKELLQMRKALQGQVATIGDAVSEVAYDTRTHPHTRLQLEKVLEKCQSRKS